MAREGGCQCGAVRFRAAGEPERVGICHCADCRRAAAAPMMAWAVYPREQFAIIRGEAQAYNSSPDVYRHFCPVCGTGLFYVNEVVLPGLVDVQVAAFDDPDTLVPEGQIQVAERIGWMADLDRMPTFERYPG